MALSSYNLPTLMDFSWGVKAQQEDAQKRISKKNEILIELTRRYGKYYKLSKFNWFTIKFDFIIIF